MKVDRNLVEVGCLDNFVCLDPCGEWNERNLYYASDAVSVNNRKAMFSAELFGRWPGGTYANRLTFRKRKNDGRKRCDDMKKAACEGRISRASRARALVIWHIFMKTFSVFAASTSDLICKIIGSQSPMIQDERLTKHQYKKSLVRSCKSEV